jgi:hypothetical protein
MHTHKRTHSTDGFWTWRRRNVAARCCAIYLAMVARIRTCSYLCTNPGIEHARTDHINPLRDCIVIRHPRICPPPPHSTIAYARQSVGDGVMHATATTCYWVAVGCGDMHGHPIALRGWHGLGWGATENTHLHRSQCGRHVHIAGPAAPFPPSIFISRQEQAWHRSISVDMHRFQDGNGRLTACGLPASGWPSSSFSSQTYAARAGIQSVSCVRALARTPPIATACSDHICHPPNASRR